MPIGDRAVYTPVNIPLGLDWMPLSKLDEENIILKPDAPLVDIFYNDVGWSGGNRCVQQGGSLAKVPIPTNFIIANNGENESSAILMPDRRTIVQVQPLTRCQAGGYATSLVKFDTVDITGPGIPGAHGGSNLSAFGGSIRRGELRKGQIGMRHAMKVIVNATTTLYKCKTSSECYRWPASTADGYALGYYGAANANPVRAMVQGSLLALPASVDIAKMGLETEPGRQLAWTYQNYGAYVVDDTYGDGFGYATEKGPDGSFRDQFRADWGYEFAAKNSDNTPWARDLKKLIQQLQVVDNNSASSIGGGGNPRQPLLPGI